MKLAATHTRRCHARGFTLVELLAVVAMIGILSVLAILGYQRYLNSARTGEAKDIIAAIHVSEENYRAETLGYLSCSASLTDWYPADPSEKKRHWLNPSHSDYDCWRMLNVTTDAPTYFGFTVKAGTPGETPTEATTNEKPQWPNNPGEPWYVIQAAGDLDGDGVPAVFVSSSFNSEIYVENEGE